MTKRWKQCHAIARHWRILRQKTCPRACFVPMWSNGDRHDRARSSSTRRVDMHRLQPRRFSERAGRRASPAASISTSTLRGPRIPALKSCCLPCEERLQALQPLRFHAVRHLGSSPAARRCRGRGLVFEGVGARVAHRPRPARRVSEKSSSVSPGKPDDEVAGEREGSGARVSRSFFDQAKIEAAVVLSVHRGEHLSRAGLHRPGADRA